MPWKILIKQSLMDPKFTEAYINRGNVYRDIGKYDEAFKDFNTALQQKPDLALVYFNIGNLYYLQKRMKRLYRIYQKPFH